MKKNKNFLASERVAQDQGQGEGAESPARGADGGWGRAARMADPEELYDEFGNYIGPDPDEDEDDEGDEDDMLESAFRGGAGGGNAEGEGDEMEEDEGPMAPGAGAVVLHEDKQVCAALPPALPCPGAARARVRSPPARSPPPTDSCARGSTTPTPRTFTPARRRLCRTRTRSRWRSPSLHPSAPRISTMSRRRRP